MTTLTPADAQLPTFEEKEKHPLCAPPLCDWASLEKDFEAHRPYKSIVYRGKPLKEQLELASQEWVDRFMKDDGKDSGVPAVLVATNVPQSWTPDESNNTCLVLTEDGNLYVKKVPNPARAVAHGEVTARIGVFRAATQTEDFISVLAGAATEPDILLIPTFSWDGNDNGKARGMIEIEYKHRGPDASRAQGFAFLNASHFHRFYMLLRIYPRRVDGTFAAACVLWRKNTVHIPVLPPVVPPAPPGSLVCPPPALPAGPTPAASPIANAALAAPVIGGILPGVGYDFGTAPLHHTALAQYTAGLGAGFLPLTVFGPPLGTWTAANNPAFQVPIPAMDVFYLIRDEAGGLVFPNPVLNLEINLGLVQKHLNKGTTNFDAVTDV